MKIVDENDKPIVYNDKIRVLYIKESKCPYMGVRCYVGYYLKGVQNGTYYKNSTCCL
jgi:hypothetical protein